MKNLLLEESLMRLLEKKEFLENSNYIKERVNNFDLDNLEFINKEEEVEYYLSYLLENDSYLVIILKEEELLFLEVNKNDYYIIKSISISKEELFDDLDYVL